MYIIRVTMTKQTYDIDGSTYFSCSFMEDGEEWDLKFSQGFIRILAPYKAIIIEFNYPEEEHWTYTLNKRTVRDGVVTQGAKIQTSAFTLSVETMENIFSENVGYSYTGDSKGYLDAYMSCGVNSHHTCIPIPYLVAAGIMRFMSGSTTLDGAFHAQRY